MAATSTLQTGSKIRPIRVIDGRVELLDQRKIPESTEYFDATLLDDMCFAISDMVVRGAPAIGVAAALGLASEAKRLATISTSISNFLQSLTEAKNRLDATRPTAVNLRWATQRIYRLAENNQDKTLPALAEHLFSQAEQMIEEDIAINMSMGKHGSALLLDKQNIITHCNAGALATCGWGTALGVIRSAVQLGAKLTIYVDETRPRQQGFRLTAWELMTDNITPVLITDSMAGHLMAQGKVDAVIVGADRIAGNGDAANKIGTYSLAVLAKAHKIPFYVAAPLSTIDPHVKSGADIPIEERHPSEVTVFGDKDLCPEGARVYNPAFDVTPAKFITAIITEAGVLQAPYKQAIAVALKR